jgi:hypothetical protein
VRCAAQTRSSWPASTRPGTFQSPSQIRRGKAENPVSAEPGTVHKIEHRLFSFIARNWRGQPLISRQAVVSLIAATTSTKGLKVYAELDENSYQRSIKITDTQLAAVNLVRDDFHGEWNYRIEPSR